MNSHSLTLFFLQLALMLLAAILGGKAARFFKLPAVLGELTGGIILGPTCLGSWFPHLFQSIFPTEGSLPEMREGILKLGMLFFLLIAGLEIQIEDIRRQAKTAAWTSLLGTLIPFILGWGAVILFPSFWEPYLQSDPMTFALFLGTALSISALPVILRILMDLKMLRSPLGSLIMTSASISDLLGWSLFAVVLTRFSSGEANLPHFFAHIGTIFLCGGFTFWILRRWAVKFLNTPSITSKNSTHLLGLTLLLTLALAAGAEKLGVHAIFGAFLTGLILNGAQEKWKDAHDALAQLVLGFFAPLYFVSLGLKANFVAHFDLPLVLIILLIACFGKIVGAFWGGKMGGLKGSDSLSLGFALNARGAMEMVLASVALEQKLIDPKVFIALMVMAMITSIMSGPAMAYLKRNN